MSWRFAQRAGCKCVSECVRSTWVCVLRQFAALWTIRLWEMRLITWYIIIQCYYYYYSPLSLGFHSIACLVMLSGDLRRACGLKKKIQPAQTSWLSRQNKHQTSKLDLCEGRKLFNCIVDSDVQLSVYSFSCFISVLSVCRFVKDNVCRKFEHCCVLSIIIIKKRSFLTS